MIKLIVILPFNYICSILVVARNDHVRPGRLLLACDSKIHDLVDLKERLTGPLYRHLD